ncbi:MAG: T9SS type A sorting domain-containing protein [Bacteroidetes bacterium]|nr:T9SS type A sorting domain-containing protein [Bacteroidota bacterium]
MIQHFVEWNTYWRNFSGTGVAGNVFDPSIAGAGTYTITYNYTDGNSCSNSDNKTITVDLCTGITELNNNSFVAYPNPTTDNFTIDFNKSNNNVIEIEVYDAIGKLVLAQTTSNNHTVISLEQLAKGIYNVRLKDNGSYTTIRVIKE